MNTLKSVRLLGPNHVPNRTHGPCYATCLFLAHLQVWPMLRNVLVVCTETCSMLRIVLIVCTWEHARCYAMWVVEYPCYIFSSPSSLAGTQKKWTQIFRSLKCFLPIVLSKTNSSPLFTNWPKATRKLIKPTHPLILKGYTIVSGRVGVYRGPAFHRRKTRWPLGTPRSPVLKDQHAYPPVMSDIKSHVCVKQREKRE